MSSKLFTISRNNWLTDLLALSLILFLFYNLWIGSYPLFIPDEGRYSEIAREMVASKDFITPRLDGLPFLDKPILYYWLQSLSIHLFGIHEWALRFFPMLFGVMSCLCTYLFGRILFNRRTGILAALILASSPLYFVAAHYANLDLEVAVFISLTLLFFITAHSAKSSRIKYILFLTSFIFASLAFLTKGLIGLVFPCLISGLWILLSKRWAILKKVPFITGTLIFLAINLPWYILVSKANPKFLQYFFVNQQFTRFVSSNEFNNKSTLWFYLPIIAVGFFPWTIFLIQSFIYQIKNVIRSIKLNETQLFLLSWITIIFLFFSIPSSKVATYILPIFPAMALLVGNYLANAWGKENKKFLFLPSLLFILFATCFLLAINLFPLREVLNFSRTPLIYYDAVIFSLTTFIAAILSIFLIRKNSLNLTFTLFLSYSSIMLLLLIFSAASINQGSIKPLVLQLKAIKKPNDEVINYYKYFHDAPLYLGQTIKVVEDWDDASIPLRDNWARELWMGGKFQTKENILMSKKSFWSEWKSKKHIYVLVAENTFDAFKENADKYRVIAKYNDVYLLSNGER